MTYMKNNTLNNILNQSLHDVNIKLLKWNCNQVIDQIKLLLVKNVQCEMLLLF